VAGKTEHNPADANDEIFRLLVESVVDYAIFVLDAEGRVVTWNPGAERIKGYSADEILGRHFSIFYPAEDLEAGLPQRELDEATTRGRVEREGWRLRKDGSRFWALVLLTALRGENGELRGFAKVTRDLTEQRQHEQNENRLTEINLRRQHALEINDDVVQGLAVADLALHLGEFDKAREAVARTLLAARRLVTEFLAGVPRPGELRRTGDRSPTES
jgi:PAS domain S-box-containing protein